LLGRPAQTRQIASITFRRPAAPNRVCGLRIHPAPLGSKLALSHRLPSFFVERLRDRSRAALVRQSTNNHRPDKITDPNLHRVPEPNRSSRFDPIVIHQDLPEVDGFLGKRTRLKKTRRPKPFVESDRRGARQCGPIHERINVGPSTRVHQRGSVE
jgi:hypothetical protein